MLESHAIISILLSGVGESNMHFAKIFVVGPFQRHYVITYFSPINSSAVQIHLYILPKIGVSMLFVCSWNLCVSVMPSLNRGVNLYWFQIQFNYYYHYQLNVMCHILSFQYYCM